MLANLWGLLTTALSTFSTLGHDSQRSAEGLQGSRPPGKEVCSTKTLHLSPETARRQEEVSKLRAVYINLGHRLDRKENMEAILNNYDIPHTRFPAIYGVDIKDYLFEEKPLPFKLNKRTAFHPDVLKPHAWTADRHWGRIGCWQSHVQVLLNLIQDVEEGKAPDGPVLILEDDITWPESFGREGLLKHLTELPDNWELMAYGLINMVCVLYSPPISLPDGVCRTVHGFRAHAYVIRNISVAKKLLSVLNTKMPQVLDVGWNLAFERHLVAYGSGGFIEQKFNFGTDIVDNFETFVPVEPFWHKDENQN